LDDGDLFVYYSISPPALTSISLEGKNWPTCKTVQLFLKLVLLKDTLLLFAETLRSFGF
jgi:hypothetical protein